MGENATLAKWRKFEYVIIGVNDENSEKKKLTLVDKLTAPGEMFSCLKDLLQMYPAHQFQANWQNKQMRELVENYQLVMPLQFMTTQKTMHAPCKIKVSRSTSPKCKHQSMSPFSTAMP